MGTSGVQAQGTRKEIPDLHWAARVRLDLPAAGACPRSPPLPLSWLLDHVAWLGVAWRGRRAEVIAIYRGLVL